MINSNSNTQNNLESLRGMACLMVVFSHVFGYGKILDSQYGITQFTTYGFPGHFAVLIFFMLSGYVIGLNYPQPMTSMKEVLQYSKKRIVRIYPIFVVSLLFSFVFLIPSLYETICHFFFLHVALVDVVGSNHPLWSIHYEMFFYTFFIVLSVCRISTAWFLVVSVLGALILSYFPVACSQLIVSYLVGLFFWVSGLLLSKQKALEFKENNVEQLSLLILFFAIIYNPFTKLFAGLVRFEMDSNSLSNLVQIYDFPFWLVCVCFVYMFSNKYSKYHKLILAIPFLFAISSLILIAKIKHLFVLELNHIWVLMILVFLSISILFIKKIEFSNKVFKFLKMTGGLSYAMYVFHVPLLTTFGSIKMFSGTLPFYILRLLVYMASLYLLAYFFEKKFQPWVRSFFFPKKISS